MVVRCVGLSGCRLGLYSDRLLFLVMFHMEQEKPPPKRGLCYCFRRSGR
nr:MAG TPA: hypothetical protein [Caudoviricetes sp.]